MKIIKLALFSAVVLTTQLGRTAPLRAAASPRSATSATELAQDGSDAFVENRGQWDTRAMFLAQSRGIDSWVTQEGVVYDFHQFVPDGGDAKPNQAGRSLPSGTTLGHVVRMSFVSASPFIVEGESPMSGAFNYFIGNNPSNWVTNARRFGEVKGREVYPGISARYYFDGGAPRYDLVVAPGADPSRIQMKFEGADSLEVEPSGVLRIGTSLGAVEQRGLSVYQTGDAGKAVVPCEMVTDGQSVRFQVGSYDHSKPLVIDPLIFGTYLGGTGVSGFTPDVCNAVALDSTGNVVVAGYTGSLDFPTTTGAYQRTDKNSNAYTGFVAKLSADGKSLLFGTYLGGSGANYYMDECNAVVVNSSNNIVVAGLTGSTDFPTTTGAYQTKNGNPYYTGFVVELSSDGKSLLFGSYLGGKGGPGGGRPDTCNALALDSKGNIAVAGQTGSIAFPTTVGAYQRTTNNGNYVGFVAKLSADGKTLLYGSYLGVSSAVQYDACNAIGLDSAGNYVVAGQTGSTFPITTGAYQTTNKNEAATEGTGFVAKLSADGKSLLFGTYLGGNGANDTDNCTALAVDSSGNVVVAGNTGSTNFPTSPGAFQATNKNPRSTGFVARLSSDGKTLLAGSYYGGSGANGTDAVSAMALDSGGNPVIAGTTASTNLVVTAGAFETTNRETDTFFTGFIAKLSADEKYLPFGSYIGGSESINGSNNYTNGDYCNALALDATGRCGDGGRHWFGPVSNDNGRLSDRKQKLQLHGLRGQRQLACLRFGPKHFARIDPRRLNCERQGDGFSSGQWFGRCSIVFVEQRLCGSGAQNISHGGLEHGHRPGENFRRNRDHHGDADRDLSGHV